MFIPFGSIDKKITKNNISIQSINQGAFNVRLLLTNRNNIKSKIT